MRVLLAAAVFASIHGQALPNGALVHDVPAPPAPKVVVVTIDGTMWQDVVVARPSMPTLARWATTDGAIVGTDETTPMEASGPNFVSQPGYTELFTGRPSPCTSNGCARTAQRTLVDDLPADAHFAVISSWERIALAASSADRPGFVSCGRTTRTASSPEIEALAKSMETVDPAPGVGDYRPDASTIDLALEVLRVERPQFLFVGLGDTDEYAHRGDYVGYLGALDRADAFLAAMEKVLEANGDAKSTTIFVTVDHGRSDGFRDHGEAFPESRRVWLVAHGAAITARGPVKSPTLRHLANVAPTVRAILKMAPVPGPDAGTPLTELGVGR